MAVPMAILDAARLGDRETVVAWPGGGTVDRGGVPPTCDASEAFVVGS